jgi:hypothetical protein
MIGIRRHIAILAIFCGLFEADRGALAVSAPPTPVESMESLRKVMTDSLPARVNGQGELVVIPLRGEFSFYFDARTPAIAPDMFRCLLEVAAARSPDLIILDIESGGGLQVVMDEIIDSILRAQRDRELRIVSWTGRAYSAAALTAMACREIVAKPGSVIGAATTLKNGVEARADSALDQKIASVRDARRREVAEITGRSVLIQEAMELPSKRLWYHPTFGFSDSPPQMDTRGWTALDTSDQRPMSLNATELTRTTIAIGEAGDLSAVCRLLSVPRELQVLVLDPWSPQSIDKSGPLLRQMDQYFERARARMDRSVWNRIRASLDNVDLALRTVEAQGAKPSWNDRDKREIERKLKECRSKLPRFDQSVKKLLEEFGYRECIEARLQIASDALGSAIKTLDAHHEILHLGAIYQDLHLARLALNSAAQRCAEIEDVTPETAPAKPTGSS